ncbi:MAG: radical SAM protein [Oligoflexia bacterium]|nr:radical SAM protein [Oligoflexia bacterium]
MLFKKRRLRYVDFALDFTCNQSCQHCFAKAYDRQYELGRDHLSKFDYERISREAIALGAVSFSIQGGEPFAMMKDTVKVMSSLPKNRCLISIKSNGSLITVEKLRLLASLGLDIVTISLDSGFPEEHDEFRGHKLAWQKALEGIKFCKQENIKVMLACTIGSQNIRSKGFLRLIELSSELGVLLLLIYAAPTGKWQGQTECLLKEADFSLIKELLNKYKHLRTDFDANWFKKGCGALKEIIYISQYGDVMPCPFIPISFGNLFRDSLLTVWEKSNDAPFFSKYSSTCLIGEDQDFIKKYSQAIKSAKRLPISWEDFLQTL